MYLKCLLLVSLLCSVSFAGQMPYKINNNNPKNREYFLDTNFQYLATNKADSNNSVLTGTTTAKQINVSSITATGEITTGYGFFHDRGDPASLDMQHTGMTMNNTWVDWDLSAIVPAGTKAVVIRCFAYDNTVGGSLAFRKNGNSNAVNIAQWYEGVSNDASQVDLIVACDANRIIEYKASETLTRVDLVVAGWWK